MKVLLKLVVAVVTAAAGVSTAQGLLYGVGRAASEAEIDAWDTPLDPAGNALPEGSGTAALGAAWYDRYCESCHGPGGSGGSYQALTGRMRVYPAETWYLIYRSMPRSLSNPAVRERQLSPDEVYALTAYILYINGMAAENDVLNARNLAPVRIPEPGFITETH